ncbi:DUF4351 domain-containing protein [Leptolyngbya sp. GGD]|uniref:DUF4351 domain-containing protein n=1 Tax=Leptolyngbya sp. GGD TaxID=2997907 RepID=UPI00227BAEEF|nr:DUF4351 domain-containing protein [Leptolyngbya sp. GGD]MCY6493924.1 DUF4351 domain-containing protein [Leptolyngbya sp. GGD]
MAQNSFDQLSKQYLEEFLAPLGTVQRQYEIPGEAKFADLWFVPNSDALPAPDLGLLGRMVGKPCLFEPYRNVPTRTEVRVSIMKLVWVQEDERRKAQQDELAEDALPQLWILAATTSRPLLEEAEVKAKSDWMPGVYFLAGILKTAIVAIDQLPEVEETLWLRVLGRGATQERAIREVLALPIDHPRRGNVLRLLASWKVRIDLGELVDFAEREEIMALSEAFLAWEAETQTRSQAEGARHQARSLILLQLEQKFGALPDEANAQISALNLDQLGRLAIALLNFTVVSDLMTWLHEQQN